MLEKIIRIATRKSPLALWQAEHVKKQLLNANPGIRVELVTMVTRGDVLLDSPLSKVGGKGLFVKELELAILEDRADLAVHSMKDVPVAFPDGLGLMSICAREDPHDAFISCHYRTLDDLPPGAVVGTSSLRRQCQISAYRPDLIIRSLRGNVGTRLAKLDAGEYDAIILAAAGLIRLGLQQRITMLLPVTLSLPAGGQGAIGIECRSDDHRLTSLLQSLNDDNTATCVHAERAMNVRLEGGCQVPIASYAVLDGGQLWLRGLVGTPAGDHIIYDELRGAPEHAEQLGIALAERLLERGAAEILRCVYQGATS